MRKNIKNKILLSILAAGIFYLPACAAAADLTITPDADGKPVFAPGADSGVEANWVHTGDYNSQHIYYDGENATSNNTITIFNGDKNSTLKLPSNGENTLYIHGANADVTGGYAELTGNKIYFDSNSGSNTLQLNNGSNYLRGAYAKITGSGSATLTNNFIAFDGNNALETSAGSSIYLIGANAYIPKGNTGTATLKDNYIDINGSNTFTTSNNYIYLEGAKALINGSGTATLSSNSIAINGSNTFKINNNTISLYGTRATIYGSGTAALTGNYFNISGSNSFTTTGKNSNINLYGANANYSTSAPATLTSNSINITGDDNSNASNRFEANGTNSAINLYGARVDIGGTYYKPSTNKALISQNSLNIASSSFTGSSNLYGAYAYIIELAYADVNGNSVKINDGVTFKNPTNIYGTYVWFYGTAALDGNSVTISGGEFNDATNVYAVYLNGNSSTSEIKNNSITLTGYAGNDDNSLKNVNLYGSSHAINNSTVDNNYLVVDGWSGTVNSVNNFDSIEFNNISLNGDSEFYVTSYNTPDAMVNINTLAANDYKEGEELSVILTLDSKIDGDKIFIADRLTDTSQYITSNYGTDGIYANKTSKLSADKIGPDANGNHQIQITAGIQKIILAGKLTNADGSVIYNTNQTADTASLTLDKDLSETNASVIAGAYAAASSKEGQQNNATGGKLTLTSGSKFKEGTNLYAGYAENGSATGNTLTLTGSADVSNVNLYGGASASNAEVSGNTLTVDDWSGEVKSINKFSAITFDNISWQNGAQVLQITESTADALQGTAVTINSLNFAGGTPLAVGDSMTFISGNGTNLGTSTVQAASSFLAGVAVEGTGSATVAADGSVIYTIDAIKLTPQAQGVAQTRAASAAFLNQGTDLINDSLDVLGRNGSYGVKTFAAVQGNRSSYSVADDLKINGWSVIAGFGAENEHKGGDFAWGVFYENGSGNYRTYNTFNNEFFRGDGSMVYNGGGIAARYENAKGVYTEGSLRAGTLKNEMDNALRDASGASYGYETESTYYGAHIGVGQIFEISENTDLDVYGKFFHTYVEGDSVTIGSDKFDFDSITSDRLRVGARVTKQQAKVNTYYGLAYEYEFNGDADMTAAGIKADTQSFGGGTGIAELGFNYQPGTDSPWNFDLNLRGYVGERQGGSFNVQATYTF